jgi:hypothetical protein
MRYKQGSYNLLYNILIGYPLSKSELYKLFRNGNREYMNISQRALADPNCYSRSVIRRKSGIGARPVTFKRNPSDNKF